VRLAIGAGVPIIPTIVWGSQRIITKGLPKNFKRVGIPITVRIGNPLYFTRESNVEEAENLLKSKLVEMLNQVQAEYPDSHQGKRWAPARLGGTAPTLEEAQQAQDEKNQTGPKPA
jgi:1-acyl-sn-glycerol-3-phosphate acyltransferase